MLYCAVLGPLLIEADGVALQLGGLLQRRLLAGLLAAEGAAVPDPALAEIIWNTDTPPQDPNALRVVVSRARASLGPSGRTSLRRTAIGYQLDVPPEQTDHGRFARLAADATIRLAADQVDDAVRAFESALALWRGEPWTELTDTLDLSATITKLHELHDTAIEELAAARLARGDTTQAITELSEAAIAAPYRERRWELLALALYRAGRQTQALAELRHIRQLLGTELGIKPGPALDTIEQRILNHDPTLLRTPPGTSPVPMLRKAAPHNHPTPPAETTPPRHGAHHAGHYRHSSAARQN